MKMYSNFDITLNDTCKYQIQIQKFTMHIAFIQVLIGAPT